MSNAGSSEHCTAVTFKVCVLKSYSSLYCNFPRYSLEDVALGTSSSLTSTSSSFSTKKVFVVIPIACTIFILLCIFGSPFLEESPETPAKKTHNSANKEYDKNYDMNWL